MALQFSRQPNPSPATPRGSAEVVRDAGFGRAFSPTNMVTVPMSRVDGLVRRACPRIRARVSLYPATQCSTTRRRFFGIRRNSAARTDRWRTFPPRTTGERFNRFGRATLRCRRFRSRTSIGPHRTARPADADGLPDGGRDESLRAGVHDGEPKSSLGCAPRVTWTFRSSHRRRGLRPSSAHQ